ncbi:hypothetical protein BDV96DRAFT_288654 [Lophiotrema nucula]|uniref:F-box domain-containing protein n=1 Tax=Lophiotrema nucula TaxID=690887 RepID=A0A6A5YLK8_9PLEO|nr:hypothetical protein BDV96DRAFT_288654 [Lophiotrema nucula]
MDGADFSSLFARKPSNAARRDALEGIISQLTNHEWRYLRDRLATKSFQFDIIGSLPVELAVLVFAHLEPSAIYRSRRVSKKWNSLLKSEQLQRAAVGAWMDESICDELTALRTAQRYVRLRSGRPCHHVSIRMDFHLRNCFLVNDNMVWLSKPDARELNILNLRQGQRWQARGEAREIIRRVATSDRLVSFVTMNNTCYVIDPSTRKRSSFKLPLHLLHQVACRGSMVACAGMLDKKLNLYVWDHDTGRGDFELEVTNIPSSFPPYNFLILPIPAKRAISILSCCRAPGAHHLVCQTIDFTGKQLLKSVLPLPDKTGVHMLDYQPVDTKHRFAILGLAYVESSPGSSRIGFEFDDRSMTFTSIQCPSGPRNWVRDYGKMWWRNVSYALWSSKGNHTWATPLCRERTPRTVV